jgi:hypothetical protein
MRRAAVLSLASVVVLAMPLHRADAWMHSGAFGSASGGGGSWNAQSWRGGTASGGEGSWHAQGAAGGTASGGEGEWHGTTAYGTQASGGYDRPTQVNGENGSYVAYPSHYYGGAYYGTYHPPATVDYYGNSCGNCGGWSGGAVAAAGALGVAAGAAVGAGATAANEAAVSQANNAATYSAGVAAGEAAAAPAGVYTTLPPNCVYQVVGGSNYFQCGSMWLTAAYGANGLYYKVVPAP